MRSNHYNSVESIKQVKQALADGQPYKIMQLGEFFSKDFLTGLSFGAYESVEQALYEINEQTVLSEESSQQIISAITPFISFLDVSKLQVSVKKFTHGSYQMFGEEQKKPHAIIDLTHSWVEGSGGVLGFSDGDGERVEVPALYNSLILVAEELYSLVSYCNHYCTGQERVLLFIEEN